MEGGIGHRLTAKSLAAYGTAGRLNRYLDFAMPYEDPGGLSDGEYWALTAYLASSRSGVDVVAPWGEEQSDVALPSGKP